MLSVQERVTVDPAPRVVFKIAPAHSGWRWAAYDRFGRVAGDGVAPTKAMAAAQVIDVLSRT